MKVVVVGAGETGVTVSERFSLGGHDVVLVDKDPDSLALVEESLDAIVFEGDATLRSVLRALQIKKTDAFVAVTGSDTDNIVSAGLAKQLGAKVTIARVDNPRFFDSSAGTEREVLGINAILCATRLAASELLGLVSAVNMSYTQSFSSQALRVALAPVQAGDTLVGRAPRSVELASGVRLAAVVREGFVRSVADTDRLEAQDELLIAGDASAFLDARLSLEPEAAKERALVVGGGDVGAILAGALAGRLEKVQLVELDRHRAEQLSEELSEVTVVVGDARKSAFLKDLQIDAVSHTLAVTADDEINLLVSLLTRRLGAAHVFTLLRQPGHAELFCELGVEGAAGAFDILARSVRDVAVLSGQVSSALLPGTGYALLEWRFVPKARDRAPEPVLELLPLAPGTWVIGLVRGAASVEPAPSARLRGGETALLLTPAAQLTQLVQRLQRFNQEISA